MRLIFSINARFLSREITSFSRGRSDRIVVRVIAQSKQQVNFNHAIERTRRLGESSPNWWCTSYTLFFVYRAVCFSLGAPDSFWARDVQGTFACYTAAMSEPSQYRAYLLRLQRGQHQQAWRATLQDVNTREVLHFPTERDLLRHLLTILAASSTHEEAEDDKSTL